MSFMDKFAKPSLVKSLLPTFLPKLEDALKETLNKQKLDGTEVKALFVLYENDSNLYVATAMIDENDKVTRMIDSCEIKEFINNRLSEK